MLRRRTGMWGGAAIRFGVVAAIALLATIPVAGAQDSTQYTVGHALGSTESMFAGGLTRLAASQLDGVEVAYDDKTTDSYGRAGVRFDKRDSVADIVFLYAGRTGQLDEVTGLARRGLIQPLDALPGYAQYIRPDDIYPNLLEPVTADGHVWAVPVRVCPPCIVATADASKAVRTWNGLIELAREQTVAYQVKSDPYMLWLTLLAQRGVSQFTSGQYAFDDPVFAECFNQARALLGSGAYEKWDGCAAAIVSPDAFVNRPAFRTEMRHLPLPGGADAPVVYGESTWYVGLSSRVVGEKRKRAAQLLGAMLSETTQRTIGKRTFSPPVRPSLARVSGGTSGDSIRSVMASMTPRLRFRGNGPLVAATEPVVEEAFTKAWSAPGSFGAIMADAAARANAIIVGGASGDGEQ
ncbi:MAG: hypothetical protein GY851_03660 [bacterium]|nr:hypothetical protein [bacterium]